MTRLIQEALLVVAVALAVIGVALGFSALDDDAPKPPLCSEPVAAAGAPTGPVVTNCHHQITQEPTP